MDAKPNPEVPSLTVPISYVRENSGFCRIYIFVFDIYDCPGLVLIHGNFRDLYGGRFWIDSLVAQTRDRSFLTFVRQHGPISCHVKILPEKVRTDVLGKGKLRFPSKIRNNERLLLHFLPHTSDHTLPNRYAFQIIPSIR